MVTISIWKLLVVLVVLAHLLFNAGMLTAALFIEHVDHRNVVRQLVSIILAGWCMLICYHAWDWFIRWRNKKYGVIFPTGEARRLPRTIG